MAHDLEMREPQKVLVKLDEAVDALKKIKGTIETTAQIGNMDLKIGGLSNSFSKLEELTKDMDDAVKIVQTTKESIEQQVAIFARNNEDITY